MTLATHGAPTPATVYVLTAGGIPPADATAAMFVQTQRLRDPAALEVAARRGITSAPHCDARSSSVPADAVLLGRAALDGWLQHQLGQDEPGSYPPELVHRLDTMPEPELGRTLVAMYNAITACGAEVPLPGTTVS